MRILPTILLIFIQNIRNMQVLLSFPLYNSTNILHLASRKHTAKMFLLDRLAFGLNELFLPLDNLSLNSESSSGSMRHIFFAFTIRLINL